MTATTTCWRGPSCAGSSTSPSSRPRRMEGLAYLTLGLANVAPFILRAPYVYEVAIAGGYFFLTGSALFFASAGDGGGASMRRLSLGSLFLGLAVGCRPNLLVAV